MSPDRTSDDKPYRTVIDFVRTGGAGQVIGLLLKLTNTSAGWESAASIMFEDGSVSTPVITKYSTLSDDAFAHPDGLRLSIASLDLANGTKAEGWLEVSMLASSFESKIDTATGKPMPDPDPDKVNFDWFFSANPSAPGEAVTPAALSKMVEAQARIIAVSPPVVVSRAVLGS
jgi:hypothetical protein